jgi:spore coat polysaccharide biosynthesis protein SpsF
MSGMVAVLQARASSSRLPGKVLRPILGQPMLARQIERILRAKNIDEVVVATSTDSSDDPLVEICRNAGISCFRGSLDDVLDRVFIAARSRAANDIVRLTGDCPLADPAVIDHVIEAYRASGADYASNTLQPTLPDGLDVEVASFLALQRAWADARLPSEREHVTPYLYVHPELFRLHPVQWPTDLSSLRWTVDTAADFEFVTAVYENLYPTKSAFTMDDVLRLLDSRPDLLAINQGHKRNEGFLKSRARDAEVSATQDQKG